MRRQRNAKIIATLGPATSTTEMIDCLFRAGADVFRLNFSHGTHEEHQKCFEKIREQEKIHQRPIAVLLDLQGPKLRVGTTKTDVIHLYQGQRFVLDSQNEPGDNQRINLPHPEIFAALKVNEHILLDDGRLCLRIDRVTPNYAETIVEVGGPLKSRKGVNVPGVHLPISALTEKDRVDLAFGLNLGVDWVALSFVQSPQDIIEAKALIQGRAAVISKLEKPQAIHHLIEVIRLSDAVMVARGDLGVEIPPEDVPCLQKRIIRECRQQGKPVIVATQMLDSMVSHPTPTRAEASDVATAIYDGVDAVMLSAESASGDYPIEAVSIMDRIIQRVEADSTYRQLLDSSRPQPDETIAEAIMVAAGQIAHILPISVIVAFTDSGSTVLRAARERPESPIIGLTTTLSTARRLSLIWGVHALVTEKIANFSQMVRDGVQAALDQNFAQKGDHVIITAGVPFGISGTTNIIRVARVDEESLRET